MLLPPVAILYITSLGLVYLITGSLYLLTLFTDFTYPHPNSGNHQSVLCICEPEVLLLLLFLNSMYHKIIWYLSFSVWLMSFNIVPSRCIYIITNGKTSFSLWLNHAPLCVCVCVCVYIPYLLYPFICQQTLRSFPCLAVVNKTTMNMEDAYIFLRRRQWQPTPVLLPGKSHGRSLVGCSPWGR